MGEASGADTWGIFGAVPPARQEEASPKIRRDRARSLTPAVYWHAWVGCFCPGGTKRRGSLWKSKKYLEFFKRHCYGENLYVKTLFEK